MGDAQCHPDYQRSHGTKDALEQAQWLGEVFTSKLSPKQYADRCKRSYEGLVGYYKGHEASPAKFPQTITNDTDAMISMMKNMKKK